jgi:hypothetical protein
MTLDELIDEGERLVRPSWLLRPDRTASGIVAYWGGERGDKPNALPPEVTAFRARRHTVSLSESLLAELGVRQGPVSLFEWDSAGNATTARAEADHRLRFVDLQFSGEPLYASAEPSFPPFEAVCLYGSNRVAEWLTEKDLSRHDYWQVIDQVRDGYVNEWKRRSAFYLADADVIVGGWHFLWPDDDFYTPPELQLLALTLRDAEPWYEIWYSRPSFGFRAKARIT